MSASNWADCPQCGKGESLREDYEIYIEDGAVKVVYDCRCELCGLRDSFSYKYPLTIDPAILADILAKKHQERIAQIQAEKKLLDEEIVELGGTP